MDNVKNFLEALSKNYYLDFITNVNSNFIDLNENFILVKYVHGEYFEKELDIIKQTQEEILIEIKKLYLDALSEIYLKVSVAKIGELETFLKYNIKALNVKIDILRNDFYIDQTSSRYFSSILDDYEIRNYDEISKIPSNPKFDFTDKTLEQLVKEFTKKNVKVMNSMYREYMSEYYQYRFKVLTDLPYQLFHIAVDFFIKLKKIKVDLDNPNNSGKIKWLGKKTHIGFILSSLMQEGYIEAPLSPNGDVNYTAFAKQIKSIFYVDISTDSLRKYLNPDDYKFAENKKTFEKEEFRLPNVKRVN